jgi:hypothetical protein
MWESGGNVPHILNFRTRYRRVIDFAFLFLLSVKSPRYRLNKRLGVPHYRSVNGNLNNFYVRSDVMAAANAKVTVLRGVTPGRSRYVLGNSILMVEDNSTLKKAVAGTYCDMSHIVGLRNSFLGTGR